MSGIGSALLTLRRRVNCGPPSWLPMVATLLVVAACIGLGRGTRTVDIVLAAVLTVVAFLIPPLGLVAVVAGCLMSHLEFATGTATPVRFALVIAPLLGGLWFIESLARRNFAVLRLPAVQAIVALALVACAAFVTGNLPSIGFGRTAPLAAQLGGLAVFVCTAAVVVVAAAWLDDERWLQRVTWLFLAIATLMVGGRLVPELAQAAEWTLTFGSSGSLTWAWLAALASAQALLNRSLNWRIRLLLGLAVLAELYLALGDGREWLAGWFPAVVGVAAVAWLTAPRLTLLACALGAFAMADRLSSVVGRILSIGDNQYSLDTRLDALRILLAEVLPANPLLGLGPANYYHVTPLFPIRGYAVNFSSHSTYVDLLAQTGIVGFACFVWFACALAYSGWRTRDRAPAGFQHAFAVGALGGLAGTLAAGAVGDWLLPFPYNVSLAGLSASLPGWVFLGGLIALGRQVESMDKRPGWTPAPRAWSVRRTLFAITATAVLVRIAVAVVLGDRADAISGAADQVSYDMLATRVVSGHGFTFPRNWYPFTPADTPTAHWSYLYTLYLAGVYALFGHHPLAARLLQAVASGVGCWLIFRIGRRLFDERVGLAAAALTAVYAYLIFFNAALMTQTFFILALLASIDRALAIAERPTTAGWVALGVCLGIGALLRQTLLLYVPLLLGWLLWVLRGRARWRDALLSVALIGVCVLPWTVRNYVAFGDFLLLNSNGGYFLYASNHPDQGITFDPTFTAPPPPALRGLSEPAMDRELTRTGIGFIADDPLRFLRLSWSRARSYFWLLPSEASSSASNLGRVLSFTIYLPFMLYGVWLARHRWRACMPLFLYLAVDTALHLATWSAPRYRLPSDAIMMVFAGAAVVDLTQRLRRTS